MEIVIKNIKEVELEEVDHDFILGFTDQKGTIINIYIQRRYLEKFKEDLNKYI